MALQFDLNDLLAFSRGGRAGQLPPRCRVGAHLAARLQPAHRQAGAGAGRQAARTQHAPRGAHGRGPRLRAQGVGVGWTNWTARCSRLRGIAPTRMGEVTVACVPSTVYYFLSQVIRRYRERYPKIRVRVLDASANEVLAAVSRGEADFGLNFIGGQEPEIEFHPLGRRALRRGLPARPPAGPQAPASPGPNWGAHRLHLGQQVVRQPAAAGPGAGRCARPPAGGVRGRARDHDAGPGGGRPGCGRRAVDRDARQGPPAAGQHPAGAAGGDAAGGPDPPSWPDAHAGCAAALRFLRRSRCADGASAGHGPCSRPRWGTGALRCPGPSRTLSSCGPDGTPWRPEGFDIPGVH